MNRSRYLGLVVLMVLGSSVACSDDGGGEVPPPADSGADTAQPDTGDRPDTEMPDTAMPDTAMPDTAMADTPPDVTPVKPSLDLSIINISDWHGQIDPLSVTDPVTQVTTEYGGIAVLSTYFKEERAATSGATITATSGDVTGATPSLSTYGTDLPDLPAIESMNFLGLQVDTLGNHNFDRSIAHYTKLIDKMNYTVVSSNLRNVDSVDMTCGVLGGSTGPCGFPGLKSDGKPKIVKPYHIITVGTAPNEVKVAFIGLTNPDAPKLLFPGLMGKMTVEDPSVRANDVADQARMAGAHVVVALIHHGATGYDPVAMKPTGPLIDYVTGMKAGAVDVVLGDHTNQRVNAVIGGIKVTQNLSAGRTYGRTKIKVVSGAVTAVETEVLDPIGRQSTKADVLMDSATPPKPVVCKGGTTPTACPTATPAWTCSSTTSTEGVCRRAHSCASGGTTTCPTGWMCSTDGLTCSRQVKAADPAFTPIAAPWKATLAAKFDGEIAKTTGVFLRGPTCPPGQTCPPTATVNLEREFQQPIGDLIADALLDTGSLAGAKIGITNGGGLRSSLPSSYQPSRYSLITTTGTTPPKLALSGIPTAVYSVKIEITTAGALGTMVFRWSSDGGTTWTSNVTSATTGIATLGTTGVTVTFPAVMYAADNTFAFTTKTFVRSGCSVTTPCNILLGDVYGVLPFGNQTTIRPVTAQLLWQALENGVSRKPAADGRFLHAAGFKYSFSVSASVGARVKTITLNDGTKLMDLTSTPPLAADAGKTCTVDTDCTGTGFGTAFTCVEDLDKSKKCMIKIATNDFVNAGGETVPFAAGAKLGVIFQDMAIDVAAYITKLALLTPGTHNFVAPSTTATTTRVIELP